MARRNHSAKLPDFEPVGAFASGLQFLIMSEVAAKNRAMLEHTVVPIAVTASFACELLLKALIKEETSKPPPEHKLGTLFRKLHRQTRSKVMKPICDMAPVDEQIATKYLTEIENTFVQWRYIHEPKPAKQTSPTFLLHFARAVENYLISKHDDWKYLARDRYKAAGVPPLPDDFAIEAVDWS